MGAPRPAGHTELEVRLLGPLEVLRDQEPLPLGGPKPRALLAALALEPGRVVSVDRLVENLWPGSAPDTAPHAVQVYVSQLRKKIGPLVARRPPGYLLELDAERIDAHRFARLSEEGRAALQGGSPEVAEAALRDALALWRGPALADFLYEPFAQADIARLEELRLVALEERIDADLELGRHVELVSELEALVQAQPLRERPRGQLMLALYRSGRQADALAAYRAAREALVDELGIEPGPELKQLEAAILRQDESLAPLPRSAQLQTRRLATVVSFGVEAESEGLDVETEDRLLETAADAVSAAVGRHGGVAERLADGSLTAVFGAPVAHEDDPLRAARAALEAHDALASVEGLEIRMGIATGEVVARGATATGSPLREATRLRQQAGVGEVVVGEATARLLATARLEPKDDASVLHELAPPAPAFERRQDAPFVGRRKELGILRKALRATKAESRSGLVTVLGPAGIGKTRLAFEVARRAKGVTVLSGRCLSYGDGITYWPLREVVRDVPASEERDSVLAALDADTPPPAPEIAWIFRQLCEALAREKPLVLVFDDVHWAEPTFLELVEQLADRSEAPILVVCVAREELAEEHPDFLAERAEQILLDTLTPEETDTLLDGLGATLTDLERAHIVDTAGGNPLFVEQLLALAAEGGLGEARALPATIHALLAARLDRLGPGERAVLERGAVVGEEFGADDVAALLEPAASPTVPAHLATLAGRGFVRSAGEAFRFRHVLVQEAVYRAAPKRVRAELHERFADRLDETASELPELDEFVGYHLESAFRLQTELGEGGRQTVRLSEDAGHRLGAAGIRAAKRGDMPATINLLERATSLIQEDGSLRRELLCELAIGFFTAGDSGKAERVLNEAIKSAKEAGDRRLELRATIEHEWVQLRRESGATADALLLSATDAIPVFEGVEDNRSLGRAWLLTGFVEGGRRGRYEAMAAAEERARVCYRNANWPTSTCLAQIAAALYYGPAPAVEAVACCEELLRTEVNDRVAEAHVQVFVAGLTSLQGNFVEARRLLGTAAAIYEELGIATAMAAYSKPVLADIELLADDATAAELVLRDLCEQLERAHDFAQLASRAGDHAEALYVQGRLADAEAWTGIGEVHSSDDDPDAQMFWRSVRAKVLAKQGALEEAEELARAAARIAEQTDGINRVARVQKDLGEVLRLAGKVDKATSAFDRAIELYGRKGNVVGAAQVVALHENVALV